MELVSQIRIATSRALSQLYQFEQAAGNILVNETKPEFEGDYTVVLFAFLKPLRKSADGLGNELGEALLKENPDLFSAFNVIKGFLNLSITDGYWTNFLDREYDNQAFGHQPRLGKTVMIEYSSPNTNKPLHLGHLRNNFLGWSIA